MAGGKPLEAALRLALRGEGDSGRPEWPKGDSVSACELGNTCKDDSSLSLAHHVRHEFMRGLHSAVLNAAQKRVTSWLCFQA